MPYESPFLNPELKRIDEEAYAKSVDELNADYFADLKRRRDRADIELQELQRLQMFIDAAAASPLLDQLLKQLSYEEILVNPPQIIFPEGVDKAGITWYEHPQVEIDLENERKYRCVPDRCGCSARVGYPRHLEMSQEEAAGIFYGNEEPGPPANFVPIGTQFSVRYEFEKTVPEFCPHKCPHGHWYNHEKTEDPCPPCRMCFPRKN